ncbi:MAG: transglycosylase SLT domain-containing protein [Deltaproteobacteria bacterium]
MVPVAVAGNVPGTEDVPRRVAQNSAADSLARAVAYEHGEGVPKDAKIAAALYCEAAVRGNAEAAFQLGWMYANGRGVAHDDGTAAALFELAASDGHPFARTVLGHFEGVHGLLPDCMRPLAPPPLPDPPLVAEVPDEPNPFDELSPEKQRIADVVNELAPEYGIEPRLALAVIAVESNFNVMARSEKDARGLMQLIPDTASRFKVRNPFNVRENLRGGLAYLRWLLAYYRGEVALAAAAYNAGERAVDRYRGIPPYPETRAYVRRVLDLFRHRLHPFDPTIVEPSAVAVRLGPTSD